MAFRSDKTVTLSTSGVTFDDVINKTEKDYQGARAATGQSGFDWGRLGGNIVSPVNAIGGEAATAASRGASFVKGLARSVPIGALFGAPAPVRQ